MSPQGQFLVADIGATNARFAWAGEAGLSRDVLHLRTSVSTDSGALLDLALSRLDGPRPAAAALAIAGPVEEGRGRMTNGVLRFDAAELSSRLGCPVTVINDFHAMARAVPHLEHLRQIGGGVPKPGVKAVLGPGSGLGMGVLVPRGGGWQVLASEGGHGDLAPGSPLETELLSVLQQEHGHVSWETVLSGPGLVRLYGAVCRVWGVDPKEISQEQISSLGLNADEPVCHQTLEVFFSVLGGAAGNLALTVCAQGGVYLGGGILPGLAAFAAASPLRRRFDERGPLSNMVREIPLYLILDEEPGLTGALACLRDRLNDHTTPV